MGLSKAGFYHYMHLIEILSGIFVVPGQVCMYFAVVHVTCVIIILLNSPYVQYLPELADSPPC